MFDNSERYGRLSRALHWGIALLILWQFLTVAAHEVAEDSAFEAFVGPTHKPVGTLLLLLISLRIVWALINRSRRPSSISVSAKLGHLALYGVMFLVPAVGLLRQYGSGRAFDPFGIPLFGGFDGEIQWMKETGNLLHGNLGWLLLVLIIGHIGMVIWHRKMGPVNVLPRMWGKSRA